MLTEAIVELSQKGLGMVSVIDNEGELVGVITDGDLRRQLMKKVDIYALAVTDVMTTTPKTIQVDRMAVEALQLMKEKNVGALPVLEEKKVVGTIRLQKIVQSGIV